MVAIQSHLAGGRSDGYGGNRVGISRQTNDSTEQDQRKRYGYDSGLTLVRWSSGSMDSRETLMLAIAAGSLRRR